MSNKQVKVPVTRMSLADFIEEYLPHLCGTDVSPNRLKNEVWGHWATKRLDYDIETPSAFKCVYREDNQTYHFNCVDVFQYNRDPELIDIFRKANNKYFSDCPLPIPGCLEWAEDLWEKPNGAIILGVFNEGIVGNKNPYIMRIHILKRLKIMDYDALIKIVGHEMLHMWEQIEMGDTSDKSPLFIWMARHRGVSLFIDSDKVVNKKEFEKQHKYDNVWKVSS